jgi:hypothetical protein
MANTPEQQYPASTDTTDSKPKKSGGMKFKLSAALLVILAGLGASSYLAYERGLANPYLPQMLQKQSAAGVTTPDTTPAKPIIIDNTSNPTAANGNPPAPVLAPPVADTTNNTGNSATTPPANAANAGGATNSTPATPPLASNATPTPAMPAAPTTPTAPATTPNPAASAVIVGSASTNALLSIMDAQTQWQAMQFDFNQRWDTANALQTIQNLKNQLQALNNSAALPAIGALSQTEAQIQAWHTLNPQANLAALQQTIIDADQLQIRTTQEPAKAAAPTSLWGKFIATLKSIFAIKRVNTAKDAALDTANAAIVKQGIIANLMTAQWAARNGQWQSAQSQLRTANASIQSYGQGYNLDSLKPLMDASNFPAQPDFNTVQQALMQARAQVAAQAQSERTSSAVKPSGAPL